MVIRLPQYGRSQNELPTVAQTLEFPTIVRGDPVVVAGAAGLDRRVRWVHMSEIVNIAGLLHGGEMLLTMGIVFPDDAAELTAYVDRLVEAGAAALVIGLGPRYPDRLPTALVEAAESRGLPLIALRRKIAFIDVTEEVHASLIDVQIRDLQASESIHMIFSALAVQGSKPELVLRQVAKLSGFAVVLENRSRQILAFDPAERAAGDVLAEWAEHNGQPHRPVRTYYDPLSGWLQTTVGARGNDWGRLVLMAPSAGARDLDATLDPTMTVPRSLIMLVEQAASTLAIGRLVDRESHLLDLTTHSSVLAHLLSGDGDPGELEEQAQALGVSFRRSRLAAFAFRSRDSSSQDPRDRQRALRAIASAISDAGADRGRSSLVAPVDDFTVGMVTTVPGGISDIDEAARIVERLDKAGITVIAACGGGGRGAAAARTALLEAIETAGTAASMGWSEPVVTASDLGLRGLIHTLRDDPRVIQFAERTVGALVAYDLEHRTTLVPLLRHFLDAGRNKAVAARNAFVSRPWMHERLRLIGDVLGVDLDDEATCLDLQVALLVIGTQQDRARSQKRAGS
ncbi:purine catabolism regulator [Microbacteriaceae bacterium SG_E_30_P1]|uniref:Purine catabolism regulator n=1 Tax=Antiquaquibacter oligotrophicus TaxID=2880260 RepID=A0ABT6KPQ6_9MICO|nr:PucR family transcriptional regulator [Antiquaquibacter oligotrophicus]MDH6181077.1 purine catabolism regulator [Antiquaquibacter oligotrophicus]UDF13225.1 PucR family transcriptional regulator [Antiquaquibacter oligotrophicus]